MKLVALWLNDTGVGCRRPTEPGADAWGADAWEADPGRAGAGRRDGPAGRPPHNGTGEPGAAPAWSRSVERDRLDAVVAGHAGVSYKGPEADTDPVGATPPFGGVEDARLHTLRAATGLSGRAMNVVERMGVRMPGVGMRTRRELTELPGVPPSPPATERFVPGSAKVGVVLPDDGPDEVAQPLAD